MSDESQPPALRLKPRLRAGNEPAAAVPVAPPVAPATGSTSDGTGAESGNLRPPSPVPLAVAPAPPPAAASGEKPGGIASTEPRVRLKPRLSVNPQPAQPAEAPSRPAMPIAPPGAPPAAPATVGALPAEPSLLSLPPIGVLSPVEKSPVEPPVPQPPMAAPVGETATKFKLKPKAPAPLPVGIVAPAAPATGAPELPPVAAATPPPLPSMRPVPVDAPPPPVDAPPPVKLSVAPPVPHFRAPGEEMPLPEPPPSPKRRRISKSRLIIALLAGVGIVVCAVFYALGVFSPSPLPASKAAAKPVLPPAGQGAKATTSQATKDAVPPKPASTTPAPPGPTPSALLNEIAAAPKQAIDKAKDAVAARRGNEQARIDAMAAGEEAPDKRALDTPPPGRFNNQSPPPDAAGTPVPVPGAGSLVAPGVTATTDDMVATPRASAAFKRFVADARITGVFQGTPPRALINGRTIRAGEVVDKELGVVFDSIDSEKKTITFKDRTGNPVTRKY